FVFLLIFKVFIDRAFIHPASALFFAACFERRELFTVPASACEYLPVPFAAQHHFLFTFRTSCICRLCHVFTFSSFLILSLLLLSSLPLFYVFRIPDPGTQAFCPACHSLQEVVFRSPDMFYRRYCHVYIFYCFFLFPQGFSSYALSSLR